MTKANVTDLSALSHDPDAVKWAAAFKATFPDNELAQDEGLMVGWFANAMMAMHDHMEANHRTQSTAALQAENEKLRAEVERLREENAQLKGAHWFYLGDDTSSENCRFDIGECISEDFEWDNRPEGKHVLQISGARPVPDMWVALRYYTENEKDTRADDEPYTFTVHETKESAQAALAREGEG